MKQVTKRDVAKVHGHLFNGEAMKNSSELSGYFGFPSQRHICLQTPPHMHEHPMINTKKEKKKCTHNA